MTSETKNFIIFEIMITFLSIYLSFYFIGDRKKGEVININETVVFTPPHIVIKNNIEVKMKKEIIENVIENEDDIEWLEKITNDTNGENDD